MPPPSAAEWPASEFVTVLFDTDNTGHPRAVCVTRSYSEPVGSARGRSVVRLNVDHDALRGASPRIRYAALAEALVSALLTGMSDSELAAVREFLT